MLATGAMRPHKPRRVVFLGDSITELGFEFVLADRSEPGCLRLIRALAVEVHQNWLEAPRYLTMDYWRDHKKKQLRAVAQAG